MPTGKVSIYVERSFLADDNTGVCPEDVVSQLQEWGWIGKVDVCDPLWIEYAYTWRFPDSKPEKYIENLAKLNIKSIGRYGRWKFMGIAQSLEDGLSA